MVLDVCLTGSQCSRLISFDQCYRTQTWSTSGKLSSWRSRNRRRNSKKEFKKAFRKRSRENQIGPMHRRALKRKQQLHKHTRLAAHNMDSPPSQEWKSQKCLLDVWVDVSASALLGKNKISHTGMWLQDQRNMNTHTHTYIVSPIHLSIGLQTVSDGETSPLSPRRQEGWWGATVRE